MLRKYIKCILLVCLFVLNDFLSMKTTYLPRLDCIIKIINRSLSDDTPVVDCHSNMCKAS